MKTLRPFAIVAAALTFAAPATAEKLSLSAISGYLNELESAKAEFTQINDDGTISTGDILIRRPGAIRFEYNPPDKSLVVAGQGQVAVFDDKSNQRPEVFPLTRTPLYLILAKDVDLTRAKMVVGHDEEGPSTVVTAQDPDHPEYGNIKMVFTGNPIELRQWVIADGAGSQTTVILGQLDTGVSIRSSLFNLAAEMKERGF